MSQTTKRRINPWGDDHPEKLKKMGDGWKEQVKGLLNPADQLKGLGKMVNPANFFDQLFGTPHEETPHQPLPETTPLPRRQETIIFSRESKRAEQQLHQETKQILDQLKQQVTLLEKSEKSLSQDIAKVTVEQIPKSAEGIYFLRFLEWLLSEVRKMRIKADEGRAWLSTFTGKQKKKKGYWNMYKKHGTTFGLSNERTLATQTG